MDALTKIEKHMASIGWKGDPATSFTHKEDEQGNMIARHQDPTWTADFEEACEHIERQAIIAEFERRDAAS